MTAEYLQLNLQQRRQVNQRNFHASLLALELNHIVEIATETIVEIDTVCGYVDGKMRENVLLFVNGVLVTIVIV
jgi:hypothetical protein